MQKLIALFGLVIVFISVALAQDDVEQREPVTIETLDSVFLSELKFNLRKDDQTNRCQKYLDGIKEALNDESSQADLLVKLSKSLKDRKSNSLADFTDKCYKILTGSEMPAYQAKPQEQQANDALNPQQIAVTVPKPQIAEPIPVHVVSSNNKLKETMEELEATKERLREAVEEISHLKDNLDRLNIKLMYANRDKLEANKQADLLRSRLQMGCRSC